MNLGFDIDGILADISTSQWLSVSGNPVKEQIMLKEAKTLLNPTLFLGPEDQAYIVTARQKQFKKITKRWCEKHFVGIPLLFANVKPYQSFDGLDVWRVNVARAKAEIINDLCLDIFFEDIPEVVLELRKLCPKTLKHLSVRIHST